MNINANIVIEALGGTTATARFFEVEPPSVSEWRKNGVPRARAMYLRAVRPDIYEQAAVVPKKSARDRKAA